jgi:hypothetical protein
MCYVEDVTTNFTLQVYGQKSNQKVELRNVAASLPIANNSELHLPRLQLSLL